MNIVYFTDEVLLTDPEVRRHTMRIPEVLNELKKVQPENPEWDLVVTSVLDEEFCKQSAEKKIYLVNLMQRGLWKRLKKQLDKQGTKVDLILRRDFYEEIEELLFELEVIPKNEVLNFYVIGPGFDEMPNRVKGFFAKEKFKRSLQFIDMMATDPRLSWFWQDVKETSGLSDSMIN